MPGGWRAGCIADAGSPQGGEAVEGAHLDDLDAVEHEGQSGEYGQVREGIRSDDLDAIVLQFKGGETGQAVDDTGMQRLDVIVLELQAFKAAQVLKYVDFEGLIQLRLVLHEQFGEVVRGL